ncbi:MAG: hypothetical protein AAFQ80_25135 [Cyanobacteria bacterium J06621_8]
MNLKPQILDSLKVTAEKILSNATGAKIQITNCDRLTKDGRRNLLLRCFIEPLDDLPMSFIIKKVEGEYDPDNAKSWDTQRFFNDWVGSQFLNNLSTEFQHSPRFYGGDRTVGLIVIEDVQHCQRLVEPLLGSDRILAEQSLLQYATCLAQLHGDTLGKAAEFSHMMKAVLLNFQPLKASVNIDWHQQKLSDLGIQHTDDWLKDLKAIQQTVSHPGDFLAYIHSDACPDNVLDTGKKLRLIDLETGHFGHAFLDATFCRMMFPTCWCSKRIPDRLVRKIEDTYRKILIPYFPLLENDKVFKINLVDNCGFWLLYTLSRHLNDALEKEEDFGVSTIRQRILARLECFIATSKEFDRLTGLRNTSNRILDLLLKRWTHVSSLPLYPAFSS